VTRCQRLTRLIRVGQNGIFAGHDREPCANGTKPGMNPMHREAVGSAGLHLFQELSTLAQKLTVSAP
jgi:hypothetical protein